MANYYNQLSEKGKKVPAPGVRKFLQNPDQHDKGKTIVIGFGGWFNDKQLKRGNKSAEEYAEDVADIIQTGAEKNAVVNAHWVGWLGLAGKESKKRIMAEIKSHLGGIAGNVVETVTSPVQNITEGATEVVGGAANLITGGGGDKDTDQDGFEADEGEKTNGTNGGSNGGTGNETGDGFSTEEVLEFLERDRKVRLLNGDQSTRSGDEGLENEEGESGLSNEEKALITLASQNQGGSALGGLMNSPILLIVIGLAAVAAVKL